MLTYVNPISWNIRVLYRRWKIFYCSRYHAYYLSFNFIKAMPKKMLILGNILVSKNHCRFFFYGVHAPVHIESIRTFDAW